MAACDPAKSALLHNQPQAVPRPHRVRSSKEVVHFLQHPTHVKGPAILVVFQRRTGVLAPWILRLQLLPSEFQTGRIIRFTPHLKVTAIHIRRPRDTVLIAVVLRSPRLLPRLQLRRAHRNLGLVCATHHLGDRSAYHHLREIGHRQFLVFGKPKYVRRDPQGIRQGMGRYRVFPLKVEVR